MMTLLGMALGGWMSGVIFDLTGSYRAAFANGVAWNGAEPADRRVPAVPLPAHRTPLGHSTTRRVCSRMTKSNRIEKFFT